MQRTGTINFITSKLNCIIDFAICIPELLTQSVTTSRILKGFIQAGMIDKKTNQWPDFDKIIGTCQRKVLVAEVDIVKKDFTHLYNTFFVEGPIPEEVLMRLELLKT